jgi:hypothetical protein
MPRRMIYNSAGVSVSNGDQSQFQCDDNGALLVADHGSNVIDVTLVADTSIYADNDLLAIPQVITGVFRQAGGRVRLDSVLLLDEDDQGTEVELIFMNADGSLGTINGALNPTDAVARTIVGTVLMQTYSDLINSQVAVRTGLGMIMEAAAASTSLWVAAVVRSGTPTYSASGLKLKLGFTAV